MKSLAIEIIFAQFSSQSSSLEPSYSSFYKYFPQAKYTCYTDHEFSHSQVDIRVVKPKYAQNHPRYGNRCNDLYKGIGLLNSQAEVAIAIDNDMLVVSSQVTVLPILTKHYGLCLPYNPRHLVKIDNSLGLDSDSQLDDTQGLGTAYNMTPMAYSPSCKAATLLLKNYVDKMLTHPVRGPTAMYRAVYKSKVVPYLLAPQWCVCSQNIGIGNEIILHVGHPEVKKYYAK